MVSWPLARNRDFMLVWTGETLSEVGSQASTVAYPLLVLALTGSASKAGIVGLAKWLPLPLCALPAGVLVDRVDRKLLMIGCDAARAVALVSIPLTLTLGRAAYAQVVVVAFVDGCLFAISQIAERSALGELVSTADLPSAIAQNEARWFGANLAGPPLGGLLFAAARFLPFLADALSYMASTLAVALTRTRFQQRRVGAPAQLRRELCEGIGWLWRRRFFRTTVLLFSLGNPAFTGLYLLAILIARRHGASPAAIGMMFALVGLGGVAGAMAAGPLRRRLGARTALVAQYALMAFTLPLLLVVHAAVAIGAVVAAAEFLTPLTNSTITGMRVAATPDALRGRVQAAAMTMAMSLAWAGPLAVGAAFAAAGQDATILAIVAYVLALALAAAVTPALRAPPRADA